MKIRLLGAHSLQARGSNLASCLIDGVLAIDAGSVCTALTYEEQLAVKAVLITHHHYDHIKDLPMLLATFHNHNRKLDVYASEAVHDALKYLLYYPGRLYTNFFEKPEGDPTLRCTVCAPLVPFKVGEYEVMAVPVNHSIPATGFQVTSADGRKLFYTGDTGPGLEKCWKHVSPHLLVIENSASDRFMEQARTVKHMSPTLLREELIKFRAMKSYLPRVLTTHHFPDAREEQERVDELARVSAELGVEITVGWEGTEVEA